MHGYFQRLINELWVQDQTRAKCQPSLHNIKMRKKIVTMRFEFHSDFFRYECNKEVLNMLIKCIKHSGTRAGIGPNGSNAGRLLYEWYECCSI